MSVLALIVYGSQARGDYSASSDVDLLAVLESRPLPKFEKARLNVTFYNEDDMVRSVKDGNLFMLHIVSEGRFIFDQTSLEPTLKASFKFKQSYSEEIFQASTLGWFLLSRSRDVKNWLLFNKRVAWCVRTILIAKAAELRRPLFAAGALAALFSCPSAEQLINNKQSAESEDWVFDLFADFLKLHGSLEMDAFSKSPLADQLALFRASKNIVAQKTVEGLLAKALNY